MASFQPLDKLFTQETIQVPRLVAFMAVDPYFTAARATLAAIAQAPIVTAANAIVCHASIA
ncbi:TPA: hypothetical protein DIC40_03320 [Patescibacteria group bacterium]|nr:hypothetical protein [Candidatus Gracilibacteria bacterium]